jgi:hypothetical protein
LCGEKVVNGLTCAYCDQRIHVKCAKVTVTVLTDKVSSEDGPSKWVCSLCKASAENNTGCDSDSDDVMLPMELENAILKRENVLLKRLIEEMDVSSKLLKNAVSRLEEEIATIIKPISSQRKDAKGSKYRNTAAEIAIQETETAHLKSASNHVQTAEERNNARKEKYMRILSKNTKQIDEVSDVIMEEVPVTKFKAGQVIVLGDLMIRSARNISPIMDVRWVFTQALGYPN